jgi:catechol 2,3-dioxygenase-like lactoylglutathione lyase family enzyme
MADVPTRLFNEFDRGRLTRRQLLQALGGAVAVRPLSALAQAPANTTPAKPPFEPTGWTTVLLDHFSVQVADYQKEAAYYAALMNWRVRSDDGKQAVLDIGDWGGLVIRGGYQAPAPPPAPPTPPAGAAAAGGGAAGGGRGGAGAARPPRLAVFDNVCWGIEPWDAKKVEAALRTRGLNPVADNQGKDFQSFHVKDPDGFDLQISNGSRKNRRQGAASGKLSAPAPFEATAWKSIWLDHISFQCTDYKESVAFYAALLGWKPGTDAGNQNQCEIGDVGDIIIRNGGGGRGRAADPATPVARHATMDHIAFGITPFDPDAVKADLEKRGLSVREDTGGRGDIHTAAYKSYHTTTPNGFDLQISSTTRATRTPG